jgi:uncharacterized protein
MLISAKIDYRSGDHMARSIVKLYRYPVKGLTAESLTEIKLTREHGLAYDREFALALGTTSFDPDRPEPLDKGFFLMLRNNESLAALATRFDPATGTLTIVKSGKPVLSANLATDVGRETVEIFFSNYVGAAAKGRPRVVRSEGHKFTDASVMSPVMMRAVSAINLASVRALENAVGAPVDPLRFRGNIYIEGLNPWEEFDWVNREVRIGTIAFRGLAKTPRCAAVNVNPQTAERDLNLPKAIAQSFGHVNLGVYLETLGDGELQIGDVVGSKIDVQ